MAAAEDARAAEAGRAILRQGGSAVDAAIAMQAVLSLVEPQASGIGGGAFLMVWGGERVTSYDGRETAPAGATESLFIGADGKPMTFDKAHWRPIGRHAWGFACAGSGAQGLWPPPLVATLPAGHSTL